MSRSVTAWAHIKHAGQDSAPHPLHGTLNTESWGPTRLQEANAAWAPWPAAGERQALAAHAQCLPLPRPPPTTPPSPWLTQTIAKVRRLISSTMYQLTVVRPVAKDVHEPLLALAGRVCRGQMGRCEYRRGHMDERQGPAAAAAAVSASAQEQQPQPQQQQRQQQPQPQPRSSDLNPSSSSSSSSLSLSLSSSSSSSLSRGLHHPRTGAVGGLLVESVPLHLAVAHVGAHKVAAVAQEHAVADCGGGAGSSSAHVCHAARGRPAAQPTQQGPGCRAAQLAVSSAHHFNVGRGQVGDGVHGTRSRQLSEGRQRPNARASPTSMSAGVKSEMPV